MSYLSIAVFVVFAIALSGMLSGCGSIVKTSYKKTNFRKATVYYYLPESIIKIHVTAKVLVRYRNADKAIISSDVTEQLFVVTTESIAETEELLALNYNPNAFAADEIKYGVNAKGLLETVEITAEDRTAQIIEKLSEAPQAILTGSIPVRAGDVTDVVKEFSADFNFKASALTTVSTMVPWGITILNELGGANAGTANADFSVTSDKMAAAAPPSVATLVGNNGKNEEISGLLTRPLRNLTLTFKATINNQNAEVSANVAVADVEKLINIPVTRAAFAKKVNKISVRDGIVVSNEINKPSSVEGFVSIPVNIAKAIVAIPGQLITFRYDNTKRLNDLETAKINYEKALLDNQKFALNKNQELENVKLELQKTQLKNDSELLKTKLELEMALAKAEKDNLDAQKSLKELKDELAKLKSNQ